MFFKKRKPRISKEDVFEKFEVSWWDDDHGERNDRLFRSEDEAYSFYDKKRARGTYLVKLQKLMFTYSKEY